MLKLRGPYALLYRLFSATKKAKAIPLLALGGEEV
jgi:hypothetical protein